MMQQVLTIKAKKDKEEKDKIRKVEEGTNFY